jgi:hypothetical protein
MNTFFPTLQLFFESGRSCTIDGGRLSDAFVGLDPALRFKLTDCAHEEEDRVANSILPEKFQSSGTGLVIEEAVVAQRTSIAVKHVDPQATQLWTSRNRNHLRIIKEVHTVVGLRLKGMGKTAYIWAKTRATSGERVWGNMRTAGLRDDVPIPSISFLGNDKRPGAQRNVVIQDSLIAHDRLEGKGKPPSKL